MSELTAKQKRFVAEYIVDGNGTQAAIRAGYSPHTAKEQGSRLLTLAGVSEAIQKAQKASLERVGITADRVKQELARLAFSDARAIYNPDGTQKPIHEWPDEVAAAIGSAERGPDGEFRVKRWDKNKALETLAKHFGLLKDSLEVTGKGGGPIQVQPVKPEDLTTETIERIVQEAERKRIKE